MTATQIDAVLLLLANLGSELPAAPFGIERTPKPGDFVLPDYPQGYLLNPDAVGFLEHVGESDERDQGGRLKQRWVIRSLRTSTPTAFDDLTFRVAPVPAAVRRMLHDAFAMPAAAQLGTPNSELSGRPGERGFDKFSEIAASWGHD